MESILDKLQIFNLAEEEVKGLELDPSDVQSSEEECLRSLVGNFFCEKTANFSGLKLTLTSLWKGIGPFKLRELGVNKYHFIFSNLEDKNRILKGKDWTFDSQFIILKPWDEGLDADDSSFNKIQVWVQIWNVPIQWLSKNVGLKFKSLFIDVLDVLIPESGSKMGRHMKLLVEIELNKPLLRGTMLKYNGRDVWVDFKYEGLATFCYYCGLVGHQDKSCVKRQTDISKGILREGQYGEWLKAEQRWKDMKQISTRNNSRNEAENISGAKQVQSPPKIPVVAIPLAPRLNKEIQENAENVLVEKKLQERSQVNVHPSNDTIRNEDPTILGMSKALSNCEPPKKNLNRDASTPLADDTWKLNTQANQLENLVDIPVEHPENCNFLPNRVEMDFSPRKITLQGNSSGVGKRWKRLKGKENNSADSALMSNSRSNQVEKKRQ